MSGHRIGHVIARLDAEPGAGLSIDELAQQAGLGRARFHSVFVDATGLTPGRYAALRRIELAERLLNESAMPLAEIALACGYSEQSAFSRAFKRVRGLTPKQIRRV